MAVTELARLALDLSPKERLELARRLVKSVGVPADCTEAMEEGVQRLDDLATGKVMGLMEEQFRVRVDDPPMISRIGERI